MTSKERVSAAIEFKNPDRMPIELGGVEWANRMNYPESQYPNDIIHQNAGWYTEGCLPGRNTDNWNCEWLNLIAPNLGQVVGHPLGDISKLDTYSPPDAGDLDLSEAIDMSNNRGDKYFILGYISLFERLINLRGFEDLLIDIILEEDHLLQMRDMVLTYNLRLIDRLLMLNPDAIYLADDWGSQISLLINPALWRKLFLPAYKQMIGKARDAGKHVFFHSDGLTLDILPDLIEAGVNAFWVEFGVNPIDKLSECAKDRAAFVALYDTQKLECSTLDELQVHVEQCMSTLGSSKGGYIALYESIQSKQNEVIFNAYKKRVICKKM